MNEKKEYIERGALIEKLKEKITTNYLSLYDEDTLESIIRFAEKQPAADVEPVVRGEWDKTKYKEHDFRTYYCSICGKREYYFNATQYAYCPHCGARMQNGAHMERSCSK
jgi:hypothetical protein